LNEPVQYDVRRFAYAGESRIERRNVVKDAGSAARDAVRDDDVILVSTVFVFFSFEVPSLAGPVVSVVVVVDLISMGIRPRPRFS
jgi:hypothetical protein